MKKLLLGLALIVVVGQVAFATPELNLASGATVVTVVGSGSSVFYSNSNFNGWYISFVGGQSNSPNLTGASGLFGLDITSLTATCVTTLCSQNPLYIYLSDIGFTQPVLPGGFTTTYSSTQTGGITTQYAYDDTSNIFFGTGTLIGTVGPFTASSVGSASGGGPAGPGVYSLTIEDVFNANGGAASFSTDGNISAVPEPMSLLLLGTGLLGLACFARRKR